MKAYALASRMKAKKVPVVIGGPHVTALPEEGLQYSNAVAVGEGEMVWNQILEDCRQGKLDGIYGSVECGFNMDDAPMPAFELLDIKQYNRLTVQTSRGCPHHCEFCASSVMISKPL